MQLKKAFKVTINALLPGDKIRFSSEVLEELLGGFAVIQSGGELPSPLVFSLRVRGAALNLKRECYGCVLEFTAPPGYIEISSFIALNLGLTSSSSSSSALSTVDAASSNDPPSTSRMLDLDNVMVNCAVVELEKCTSAVLAPLSANYLQIPDMRSLLESHLRSRYTTITENTILEVDFGRGKQVVKFRILSLLPNPVCLCVDTDLEVDIRPDDLLIATQAVEGKLMMAQQGKENDLKWSAEGEMEGRFSFDLGTLSPTDGLPIYFKVPLHTSGNLNYYEIQANLSKEDGDFNLFISDTNENPSLLDHTYYNVEAGPRKTLGVEVDPSSRQDKPFLYLGVEPYPLTTSGTISIKVFASQGDSKEGEKSKDVVMESSSSETEECQNCHLRIPIRTITMHTNFCLRNNTACPLCKKVLLKKDFPEHWHCEFCKSQGNKSSLEKDKHTLIEHTPIVCACGEEMIPIQISQHKQVDCPERFIVCRFCHLLLKAGKRSTSAKDLILGMGLTEHESECGSRTIVCQKCNKSFQLKDVGIHAKTHELQRQSLPLPFKLCLNFNCINPLNPKFPNTLNLCQLCYGPLYSPRHDPTNTKIHQKIVQTYHHQLTVGCNSGFCYNKYCCTSTDKSLCKDGPMNPNDAAVEAINLLQQSSLMNNGKDPNKPVFYQFCVTDKTLAQRFLLSRQIYEITDGKFQKEWCVKALMESKDDQENAMRWLNGNAPKLK